MNIRAFFLQLFCGAVGGYIAGVGFSKLSWGVLCDSLIGVAGGGAGGQIFEHFWAGDAYCTDIEVFLGKHARRMHRRRAVAGLRGIYEIDR